MERGYEVRIYPNAEQRMQIDRTLGCARWAYNKALEVRKDAYVADGTGLSTNDTVRMIPAWKAEFPWLAEVDVMGVDAGIKDLAVRSDGVRVANPHSLAKAERKLAREQRRLSRRQKGSMNRERQRVKVARCHERVANRRKDALHKATTDIIHESQAVAVEDLNVRGMMANRHLAKAVADASMGELRRQLRYKAAWYGRGYVEVSRWFPSSKLCGACGCVFDGLELSMREWECPECGARHDRDLDAARNIAAEGRRILKEEGTAGHAGTAA